MNVQSAGWFYQANNDRKGPFSSEQMSALLTAGAITEHTKVWSEALAEWTPLFRTELRALLGEKPIAPPDFTEVREAASAPASVLPAPPAAVKTYRIYDNRLLGKIVRWASLACAGISILPVTQMVRKETIEEQYKLFKFYESETAAMVFGIPMLITMLLFLIWKYRATATLFNVAGQQTITPAGAVYWYFVPIMWFWKPYEAMRNLWSGFGADSKQAYLLGSWWFTWWAGIGLAVLAGFFLPEEVTQVSEAKNYVYWSVVISGTDALSFFFAAEIVKQIYGAESQATGAGQSA